MTHAGQSGPRPGSGLYRRAALQCVAVVASLAVAGQYAEAASPDADFADRVAPLLPSVVTIQTFVDSSMGRKTFAASGFIITPSGVIITNQHVVANTSRITVTIPGLDPVPAKPLYVAEYIDFALLKVDVDRPLPALTLGDSDTVRIGDTVMVVGNPLGVGESLSVGVISALGRNIDDGRLDDFIQTDAAVNHGNSGGPMFNLQGKVIGINTAIYSSPGNTGSIGLGFAMPINDSKLIIDQYLHDGKVVIGTTGVRAQRMTPPLAAAFGLPRTAGSIVTRVLPGGTAVGKLQPGDIILKVGSQDATDTSALTKLVITTPPGTVFKVDFLRGGTPQTTDITIGREEIDPLKALPRPAAGSSDAVWYAKPSDPGFGMASIGPAERRRFMLTGNVSGVVVTHVDSRAAASRVMQPGDVILQVNDSLVRQPADITKQLRALTADHRTSAALLVAGGQGTRWVTLPLQAGG